VQTRLHGKQASGGGGSASPSIVCRDDELATVTETLGRVSAGTGSALLVPGEAGIGKSRFAAEVVELARRRHYNALCGRSQPLDRTRSFAPAVEAFGRFLRSCAPAERAELTSGLPLLGHLLPGLGLPAAAPVADARLQRTGLFEALLRLLGRIASLRPVVLLVDDLHWADDGSLELLDYLIRDLAGMPVLLVATYRPEHPATPGVSSLLGTIRGTVEAREVTLRRLDDDAIATLLAAAIGGQPAAELVQLVADRSLGVPLYVEAYGRWLVESGLLSTATGTATVASDAELGMPPAITEVIAGRLARLPPEERDAVELLAVGGEPTGVDLLTAIGGPPVGDALDSLVRRGLVVEAEDGRTTTYRLYHPLVHEVAYAAIPALRRRQLHAGFVGTLRDLRDPTGLAPHVAGAGVVIAPREAAQMLLDAGRHALGRFAYEEAAGCLARALELAESACAPMVGDILTSYGHALRLGGEASAAVRAWQRALHRTSADDAVGMAALHQLIADAYSDCGQTAAAVHEVEAALALLGDRPPTALHLELLFVVMMNHQRQLDVPAATAVADRIERLATEVATPEAKLIASCARIGHLAEQARYQEATALIRALGVVDDPVIESQGIQFRALEALAMGDLGRLRHVNVELAEVDRRGGIPGWNYRRYVYAFGEALYSGRWDDAQEVLDEFELAVADSENSRASAFGPSIGALLNAYRGEDESAEQRLRLLDDRIERGLVEPLAARGVLGILGAVVALERDDAVTALARVEPFTAKNAYVLSGVIPPWGLVALAEARAGTGDAEGARTAAAQLAVVGPDGTYPQVMARRLAGLAAHAAGDDAAARRLLLEARAGFERLRMPFETARATIEAAEIGDAPGGVADLLASAHRVATTLRAKRYEARAARLLRSVGATVPRGRRPDQAVLTQRQLEVAELVATGMSNAQIAERLFVSIRTVTAHLDHIYTRLGINSRAALATHVTEQRPGTTER
jgi:DNA-binding CsgD family transcriptional regulator